MPTRRAFLASVGIAGAATVGATGTQSTQPSTYPELPGELLEQYGWSRINQYTRTTDDDNGKDTGIFSADIGGSDNWYISEYTSKRLSAVLDQLSKGNLTGNATHLWCLRIDPKRTTSLGWRINERFGEAGEIASTLDSDIQDEFEERVRASIRDEMTIAPGPVNMRLVRTGADELISKLPGGSFATEAKSWVRGPCSALVTRTGKGVFFEKYWMRRQVAADEAMEYKGVYADWFENTEFRAVAGIVPWSRDHVSSTLNNLGYEVELEDGDGDLEEELKRLMANVVY